MTREDALRRLAGEVAQARADVEYLLTRARERADADIDKVRRSAEVALTAKLRHVRDDFRKALEGLRGEVHDLTRSSGPALAPWRFSTWSEHDADAADPTRAGQEPIRIGEINLFATDTSEDMLRIPATLVPDRTGAVIVTAGGSTLEKVRAAFVGWCVRLLAISGPGRVEIVWLDGGVGAATVPVIWRPADGAPTVLEAYYRAHLARRSGQRSGRRAEESGTSGTTGDLDVRTVIVAIGADADRVPRLGDLIAQHAVEGAALGVHLLVAPRTAPDVENDATLTIRAFDGGSRLGVSENHLGRHEIVLQDHPPGELIERVASWSVPITAITGEETPAAVSSASGAARRADTGDEPDLPQSVATAVDTAPEQPPLPREPEEVTSSPPQEREEPVASGDASQPESDVAYLGGLLAAPAQRVPRLTLGFDSRGSPLRVPLDRTLVVRGGSAVAGAALLSSYLIEVACQVNVDTVEFAILDLSDDLSVADRFDAMLDLVPHLVDYSDGISVLLALNDIVARIDDQTSLDPWLCVLVIASDSQPERVPDALKRVLVEGPSVGVVACVWTPADGSTKALGGPDDVLLTIKNGRALVSGAAGSSVSVKPPSPRSVSDVKAVAETLRQVRG